MVVADDHVQPSVRRVRERRLVRGAAVGGHHHPGAGGAQPIERVDVEAVALATAVRDVEQGLRAQRAQAEDELRGAGDAVHVVVAVDGDGLARRERVGKARGRPAHVLQEERRAQPVGERRAEKGDRGVTVADVAVPQESREQRRVRRPQVGDGIGEHPRDGRPVAPPYPSPHHRPRLPSPPAPADGRR